MGSGKTSAMLYKVNSDPDSSYIYVTPYLDEVTRVMEKTGFRFKQPYNTGAGKLDSLHKLLSNGEDIVTTHALFLMATPDTVQLIQEGGYILILDEALDVFQQYNDVVKSLDNKVVTKGDVRWLIQEGYISVSQSNYGVEWKGAATEDFHYSEIERLAKTGSLRCIDDALYWEYPVEVFTAFSHIYILTYLFESSILASYMGIYNFQYEKVSAKRSEDGSFRLYPYANDKEQRKALFPLINIYTGDLNKIGTKRNAFSVSWFNNIDAAKTHTIKNAMRSYKRQMNAPTESVMWTTTMQNDYHEKLERVKGFKFTRRLTSYEKQLSDTDKEKRKLRCFVPCTARATNEYDQRTTLMYLLNRYPNPEIEKYFSRCGHPIDKDEFATSELLQWIWRSAIRKNEKINLYIPSSRMRNLLFSWLGVDESLHLVSTNRGLEIA